MAELEDLGAGGVGLGVGCGRGLAARLAGEERAWAVKAVASNFPGPVGRGSEMVRVLNDCSFGAVVCAGLFLSYGGCGWLKVVSPGVPNVCKVLIL